MKSFAFALLVCLTAAPAQAQIYSWRDASGTLVLSNQPRTEADGKVTTYAVHGAPTVRTTAPPARAGRSDYDDMIRRYATAHGVDADLVRAVIQAESGFNPYAVSPKGAMGLMQLMPATARALGVRFPFQPEENIRGGVTYLAQLLERFDQNVELALAAYNAGPGAVERYGNAVPPYRETQAYVKRITGAPGVAADGPPSEPATVIYKWIAIVDGRPVVRYSNVPPKDIPYEIVGSSR